VQIEVMERVKEIAQRLLAEKSKLSAELASGR
jgi:hypothetical protein